MIWLKDRDDRIIRANATASESIGRTPGEVEGRPTSELYPQNAATYRADDLEVMRSGEPKLGIVEKYETGRDQFRRVRTNKTPYRNDAGEVVGVVVAAIDVTPWKLADEERTRLYERLKELDEVKTRFFANVSHELRTPIGLILGLAERSLKDPSLTETLRTDLDMIVQNARALRGCVNDLLDAAKLEARRMQPDYARIDLASLVRRTAAMFEGIAAEKEISFQIEGPESLVAEADPSMVRRIVSNLISNAFRYTPRGGRVRVASAEQDRGVLQIVVEDSGPGIPMHLRQRVFERFFQVPDNGAGGGTGLGTLDCEGLRGASRWRGLGRRVAPRRSAVPDRGPLACTGRDTGERSRRGGS